MGEQPFKEEDIALKIEIVQTKDKKVFVAFPATATGMMDPSLTLQLLGVGIKHLGDILRKQIESMAKAMTEQPKPPLIYPASAPLPPEFRRKP